MTKDLSGIEAVACELDTAVRALHALGDRMEDDDAREDNTASIVRFMANHLRGIYKRLDQEIGKVGRACRLNIVDKGEAS